MTESKTPRTDGFKWYVSTDKDGKAVRCVAIDDARQLETELAKAQADLGEALDALIACRRELSYIIKQMEVPKGGSVWAARERADDVVKKHGRIK